MKRSRTLLAGALIFFFACVAAMLIWPALSPYLVPLSLAAASLVAFTLAHRAAMRQDAVQGKRWILIGLTVLAIAFLVFIIGHLL